MPCRWLSAKGLDIPPVGRQVSLSCSAGWETETGGLASLETLPRAVPEPGMKSLWWNFINPKRLLIHEPVLPRSGYKFCCICFACSALRSTGLMLTAATDAALQNKVLEEEPHGSSAAEPFQVMLTEDLVWLSLPQPTPKKKHLSWFKPSQQAQGDILRLA